MKQFTMSVEELWQNTYNRADRRQPEFRLMGDAHEATATKLDENIDVPNEELPLYNFMLSDSYTLLWRKTREGRANGYANSYKKTFKSVKEEGLKTRIRVKSIEGDIYVIRDGHRRLNSIRTLGVETVDVYES